jgi:hypothetical protein
MQQPLIDKGPLLMKSVFRLSACAFLALFLIVPPSADARERLFVRGGNRFPRLKKKQELKPPYQSISAINMSAHTISLQYVNTPNPAPKTLRFNENTEIEVNGHRATIYDLQVGMRVACGLGTDPSVVSSLVARSAPKDPAQSSGNQGSRQNAGRRAARVR